MDAEDTYEAIWLNESFTLMDTFTTLIGESESTSYPDIGNIIAALLYLIISVLGIMGNSLVLLAVTMSRRLQTSANAFVVALSVSDFITSITLPIQSAALLGAWSQAFFYFCTGAASLFYIFIGANVHLLAVIAFNRYIHITKHAHSYRKQFRRRRVTVMVVLSYAIPLSLTVLAHAFGGATSGICPSHKSSVNTCTVSGQTFDYVIASVIVLLVSVTLVFYILIYVHVRHHFQAVNVKITCEDDISVIYRGNVSTAGNFSSRSRSSSVLSTTPKSQGGNVEVLEGTPRNTLHPSSAKISRPKRLPNGAVLSNAIEIVETSMGHPLDKPSTSTYNPSAPFASAPHKRHNEQKPDIPGKEGCHAWQQDDKPSPEPIVLFQNLCDASSDESNEKRLRLPPRHKKSSGNEDTCSPSKNSLSAVSKNVLFHRRQNKGQTQKRSFLRYGKTEIESKITLNMFLVVVAFLACLSPTIIFLCVIHALTNSSAGCTISEAYVLVILSANCCINPIIYGWRHPLFRRVFVCILRGRIRSIERPSAWVRRLLR